MDYVLSFDHMSALFMHFLIISEVLHRTYMHVYCVSYYIFSLSSYFSIFSNLDLSVPMDIIFCHILLIQLICMYVMNVIHKVSKWTYSVFNVSAFPTPLSYMFRNPLFHHMHIVF